MLLISIILVLTAAYYYCRRHFSQWQRWGFPSDEPVIPFGSLLKVFLKEKHFGVVVSDIYEKFQDKVVGIYMFIKPALLIRDANLARQILTSDFASFHDRGVFVDEKNDPMSANIFTLRGQKWRSLRQKLTPSFSSGNLKRMFGTVDDVGNKLVQHINRQLEDGETHVFEMKKLLTTYAVDIVGSVIFGLDIDSFTNPGNEFRFLSDQQLHNAPIIERIKVMMGFVCPPLEKLLSTLGVHDPSTYRLRDIIRCTIEYREKNNVTRKDLLQSLIELKKQDKEAVEKGVETEVESMSIDKIASNSFLFYIAGSETTAATISFTIYELAMYPELLARAQMEVDECLAKHQLKPQGNFTYDFIQDLKFLDLCVMKTTRKYPGLPFLNRECTRDFQVPDTKLTIAKGTAIIVPLLAIHRDEQYFPQPMHFKPERFTETNKEYNPIAYMPFGEGPRQCIAQRMGVLNTKTALAKILANFNIGKLPRKELDFIFQTSPVLVSKEGLQVGLSKRW